MKKRFLPECKATCRDWTLGRLRVVLCSVLTIVFSLPGCGGGTSGTGVSSIEGSVKLESGEPVAQVALLVTSDAGSASSVTDANGNFRVELDTGGDQTLEIALNGAGISTSVEIEGLPDDAFELETIILVDPARNTARVGSRRVEQRPEVAQDPIDEDPNGSSSGSSPADSGRDEGEQDTSSGTSGHDESSGAGSGGSRNPRNGGDSSSAAPSPGSGGGDTNPRR